MKISFDTKEESTEELREIITCLQRIIEHRGSQESKHTQEEAAADTPQDTEQGQAESDPLQGLMGMMQEDSGKEETKKEQDSSSPEIITY